MGVLRGSGSVYASVCVQMTPSGQGSDDCPSNFFVADGGALRRIGRPETKRAPGAEGAATGSPAGLGPAQSSEGGDLITWYRVCALEVPVGHREFCRVLRAAVRQG